MRNAVLSMSASHIRTWWKPDLRSIFEKNWDPCSSTGSSSTMGNNGNWVSIWNSSSSSSSSTIRKVRGQTVCEARALHSPSISDFWLGSTSNWRISPLPLMSSPFGNKTTRSRRLGHLCWVNLRPRLKQRPLHLRSFHSFLVRFWYAPGTPTPTLWYKG